MLNHFIVYSLILALGCIYTLKKPGFFSYTVSMIAVAAIAFLTPLLMDDLIVSDLKKLLMCGAGFATLFLFFAYAKLNEQTSGEPSTLTSEKEDS